MITHDRKNKLDFFHSRDQSHPLNTFYEGEEAFDGIITDRRSCTDIFFLIIFIIFNAALVFYSQKVIRESDWRRLYFGTDFRTDFCGYFPFENQTQIYFYDPENVGTVGICVSDCPTISGLDICFYNPRNNESLDDYCYKTYNTTQVGRYCMPLNLDDPKRQIIEKETRSLINKIKNIAGDMKDVICVSFGIMLIFGMFFVLGLLIRKISFYTMLFFILAGFGFIGFMIYILFGEEQKFINKYCIDGKQENGCESGTIFFLNSRYIVDWAIDICKKIKGIPTLILYVIVHYLLVSALTLFFIFIIISAFSSGIVTTVDAPKAFPNPFIREIVVDSINYYGLIFIGFMYLWWMNAFSNFARFVVTGAVSTYYFSKSKQILNKPIIRPLKLGILKNFGSILLCSLLICIVWPIRAFFFRIKQIFEKTIDKTTKSFLFCLSFWSTCLLLYESRLKFIRTRNLIHLSIFGDSFLRSGQKLYYLRLRNESRINFFKNKQGFLRLIGDLFVSSSGAFFIYIYIYMRDSTFLEEELKNLEFNFSCPLVVFFSGLAINNIFTNFYDQLIETNLICFILDEEMFTGRHRFAETETREFMDLYGKESDDARNFANTKVNPFKIEKDSEIVKYDPVKTNAKIDRNVLNFIDINNLDGDAPKKKREVETLYDPINNRIRYHEFDNTGTPSINDFTGSLMSNKRADSLQQNLSGNLLPKTPPPKTPPPKAPEIQPMLPNSVMKDLFMKDEKLPSNNPSIGNSKINSRVTTPDKNNRINYNPLLFDPVNANNDIKKDKMQLESITPLNLSKKSIDKPKENSFVDIQRVDFDDIQNNSKNDEENKSANSSFTDWKNKNWKGNEDKFKEFNNQSKSNNKDFGKKVFAKDNPFQF